MWASAADQTHLRHGSFDLPGKIDELWTRTKWRSWIDGRPIRLSAFGTSDRTLFGFPPAGGKDVTLREWRVMLVGPHPVATRFATGRLAPTGEAT
jgi:hypothetical protein